MKRNQWNEGKKYDPTTIGKEWDKVTAWKPIEDLQAGDVKILRMTVEFKDGDVDSEWEEIKSKIPKLL